MQHNRPVVPSATDSVPARAWRSRGFVAHLGIIAGMGAWGTLIPTAHEVLQEMDPWSLATIRLVVGAPILIGVLVARHGGDWLKGHNWGRILALGAAIAGFSILYILGIALSNPIAAIVVAAAAPVASALFARFFLKAPAPRGTPLAFLLAAAGAAIASLDLEHLRPTAGTSGGEILLVVATLCWTWYSVKAQSWLGELGQQRITALSYAGGAIVLAASYAALLALGVAHWPHLPSRPLIWGLLLWIIFMITMVGGILWNFGVSRIGIVRASLYLNLIPIYGLLCTAAFGTYPSVRQLAGCLLVLLGVAVIMRRRGLPAATDDSS